MNAQKIEYNVVPETVVSADQVTVYISVDDFTEETPQVENVEVRTKGPLSDTWVNTLLDNVVHVHIKE